jgi:hypothetical protein
MKGEQKMSISGVNGIGATAYAYMNSSMKTTGEGNFASEVQKAEERQSTTSTTSAWAGDMVISQPPNYSGFTYDSSISNKTKEEMTMDEYKQWVMNEMSQMPVSGWYRSTCVGGSLIITDEAFEKMKSDPEWENTVMNMVRKMYSTNGIMGSKMIGFQVIGASPEECYGEGIPVKSDSNLDDLSDDEESWWEKRHEEFEEIIAEQIKEAQEKARAQKELAWANYLNSQLVSQQRLQGFLIESVQSGQDRTNISAFQPMGVSAYEDTISTFSKSVIESQKL